MSKLVTLAAACAVLLGGLSFASAQKADKKEKEEGKTEKQSPQEKRFNQLDANDDGKLTGAEYVAGFRATQKAVAGEKFKTADKDGDGTLTLEEYKNIGAKKKAEKKDKDPKKPAKDVNKGAAKKGKDVDKKEKD